MSSLQFGQDYQQNALKLTFQMPTQFDQNYLNPVKLNNGAKLTNPYKRVTGLENNCAMKAAFAAGGGWVMGFGMAMFMNAVEMRDIEQIGSGRVSTKMTIAKDLRKIKGTARSLAIFGTFFSVFECQVEKLRIRDDPINGFYSGAFTSMIISMNLLKGKSLMWAGFTGGIMGMGFYYMQFLMMH
ncbi:hypothetical protein ABPG72_009674 [Tetrahymena utriculariae]